MSVADPPSLVSVLLPLSRLLDIGILRKSMSSYGCKVYRVEWYLISRSCCINEFQSVRIPYPGFIRRRRAWVAKFGHEYMYNMSLRLSTMLTKPITHLRTSRSPDMPWLRSCDVPYLRGQCHLFPKFLPLRLPS